MQHQEFESPEELRDTIKCFWYNRKDFGEQQSDFEVVPDGYAEIIFHFGSGCSMSHNGCFQPLPSSLMVGLLDHPALFFTKKRLEAIGSKHFPWIELDLVRLLVG